MLLPVEELHAGQVLDQDIRVRGNILLTQGTVLESNHIRRLMRWNVYAVYVKGPLWGAATAEDLEDRMHEFEQEKERLDALFAPLEHDKQMLQLKGFMLNHMRERYGIPSS